MAKESAPVALSLHLLGPFELRVHSEPAPPLRSRQAQAVLAWLALSDGRERDRAHCAEQLWPESRPEQALANLRQNLVSVRTCLGPEANRLISADRRRIQFDVSGAFIDVLEFDRCAGSDDTLLWQRAVELYRGPLVAGLPGEFISTERNHRQRRVESLLEWLIRDEANPEGVERFAIELLRHDSTNEVALRYLMDIRSDRRDVAGTIRLFEEFRRTLRRLYGSSPSPETLSAYEKALARSKEVRAVSKGSWTPGFLRQFVGREAERLLLLDRTRDHRCVSVVGPGGIGKTRLVASCLEDTSAGVWLDCSELSQPDSLESIFRSKLGAASSDATLEELLSLRSAEGFTLVFDSVECARPTVAAWVERLCRLPGLRFVCAGREPIGVLGESVLRLAGMTDSDALAMLRVAADVDETLGRELVRLLEGVPLAIEVVGPLTAVMPISDLIEEVRRKGVLGLNRGLRDALEVSWSRLDAAEHRLLGGAASMPGAFASAQLLALVDTPCTELTLGGLVMKSWVIHDPSARFAPFSLSTMAREFIRERESVDVRKVVRVYAEFAENCRRGFHIRNGNDRLLELTAHRQNLDFATSMALEHGWGEDAYLLVGATWGCTLAQGGFVEIRGILDRCLALETSSISSKVRVMNAAGFVLRGDGKFVESLALHRQAVTIASMPGEEGILAEAHGRCGLTLCDMGDVAGALREYRAAAALFRQVEDHWWLATIQHEIASVHLIARDFASAERYLTRALLLMKDIGDPYRLAGMMEAKAEILTEKGQYEEAGQLLNQAVETYQGLGFIRNQMNCNLQVAHLAKLEGKLVECSALYGEIVRIAEEAGYRQLVLEARLRLGWVLMEQGDLPAAEVNFELAYSAARRLSQVGRVLSAKEGLAVCFLLDEQWEEARSAFSEAWSLSGSNTMPQSLDALVRRYCPNSKGFLDELESSGPQSMPSGR